MAVVLELELDPARTRFRSACGLRRRVRAGGQSRTHAQPARRRVHPVVQPASGIGLRYGPEAVTSAEWSSYSIPGFQDRHERIEAALIYRRACPS